MVSFNFEINKFHRLDNGSVVVVGISEWGREDFVVWKGGVVEWDFTVVDAGSTDEEREDVEWEIVDADNDVVKFDEEIVVDSVADRTSVVASEVFTHLSVEMSLWGVLEVVMLIVEVEEEDVDSVDALLEPKEPLHAAVELVIVLASEKATEDTASTLGVKLWLESEIELWENVDWDVDGSDGISLTVGGVELK